MSFVCKWIGLLVQVCETLVFSLPEEAPVVNRHITLREKTEGFLNIILNTTRKHNIGICIGKKLHRSSHSQRN
jgi:hypothetical protein